MSPWVKVPQRVKDIAELEAKKIEPFLAYDSRSKQERLDSLYMGFVGEVMYHWVRATLAWWVKNRKALRGKTSDSGFDTPDELNIKTVRSGSEYVLVGVDDRATKYFAVEFDAIKGIRELGTFERGDIHMVFLRNGDVARGVEIEKLK